MLGAPQEQVQTFTGSRFQVSLAGDGRVQRFPVEGGVYSGYGLGLQDGSQGLGPICPNLDSPLAARKRDSSAFTLTPKHPQQSSTTCQAPLPRKDPNTLGLRLHGLPNKYGSLEKSTTTCIAYEKA